VKGEALEELIDAAGLKGATPKKSSDGKRATLRRKRRKRRQR
jgi:hypothetical protein